MNEYCEHNWVDMSEIYRGYVVEECTKCRKREYWKVVGVSPQGTAWLEPVTKDLVPRRYR